MEEVATPVFIHPVLSSRFFEAPPMARKRDLLYQTPNFQYQQQLHQRFPSGFQNAVDDWSPKVWDWDSVRFVAKPLESESLRLGSASVEQDKKEQGAGVSMALTNGTADADDESLQLNLGGNLNSVEEPVSRPNKRVRSGSPGNSSYPMCQVDNCKEDLSNAKDYHRRHKVCQVHSKATKALVGKQMQRFCQQCSRFHPLLEFDDGKRSCRRRLAGHNRRRRKTQPENATSRLLLPENQETPGGGNLDIVNLLTTLAHAQAKNEVKVTNCSSVPDREQLIQILSKINSLPLPADFATKLQNCGILNRKFPAQVSSEHQNILDGNTSSPSTMDLLAVLSATLSASAPDALAILSQSSQSCDSEKTKLTCIDQVTGSNLQNRFPVEITSVGGERSSTSYQSPMEDSDCRILDSRANLPLQLFSSSPENDSPPKLASSRKYFSSSSSDPTEDASPSSSSPVLQKMFPIQSSTEAVKPEKMSISREGNSKFEVNRSHNCITPLELFRGSNTGGNHDSVSNFPYQAGYTSSSGSDHSPSSLNSDAQDRTGRIIFKLFDKDPSHFPGMLRSQIYNWLSKSPSEMESYIRPGCVVLSIYASMPSAAWEELEENLLQRVNSLVEDSDSDFWKSGRFLVHTGRQLVSHKEGRVYPCKSWRTYSSPELISVSPLAVVSGQDTSFFLRGRNLTKAGTKIHCTYMGGYKSKEVIGLTDQGTIYDEINLGGFKIQSGTPSVLGRCFIEVENGFKGNSLPVIVADASICKELKVLESELDEVAKLSDISEDQTPDCGQPRSRDEVLHFLNELGWLFQRKATSSVPKDSDYSLSRFKFLFTFSLERDFCSIVKTLLDILAEKYWDGSGLSGESLNTLSEIQLLNRAVKRRCRKMVDLLVQYSVNRSDDICKKYIFPPNLVGPGGITPLHLAACTSDSDDMIDALTNDPQEIGLNSWNTHLDVNGQSPYSYAVMRNNHSYNRLVARKFADRKNGQVSLIIENEIEKTNVRVQHRPQTQSQQNCSRCAVASAKYSRRFPGSQGLLQRPYIHSMLAIAAVCVCVCLFLRGSPDIGLVAPFKWENLDFGTI